MAIKKSELYSSLWASCDELRGEPLTTNAEVVRLFAISKLGWIKKHIKNFAVQPREAKYQYISGESHYRQGRRYLLQIIPNTGRPKMCVSGSKTLEMHVAPTSNIEDRKALLSRWYRAQMKKQLPALIAKKEPSVGAAAQEYRIHKMRTKWGSCNPDTGRILLNLELAKKPVACVEYILVHELIHLLERNHTSRFVALLDAFMPAWHVHRDELNRLPVGYDDWAY